MKLKVETSGGTEFPSFQSLRTQGKRQEVIESDKALVAEMHDLIRAQIGTDRYDVWFRDKVTIGIRSERLMIIMPDDFSLDQLRRRFGSMLTECGRRVAGTTVQIEWKAETVVKSKRQDVDTSSRMQKASANKDVDSSDSEQSETDVHAAHSDPSPSGTRLPSDRSLRLHAPSTQSSGSGNPNSSSPAGRINAGAPADFNSSSRSTKQANPGRFDNFVSGEHCQLAYTASSHVPARLGEVSPLFLYGPTGVGKTHLLQAINTEVRRTSRARCVMLTAEQFTSGFLEALHGRGLPSFRRKYRNTDLLILDDIQFFVGKRATLVELFYTVDALVQSGRQIVLASDRPPNELNGVGSEIIARLSAGLICSMEYPTGDTKQRLVRQVALQRGELLSDDVVSLIANELPGDARRIKGAINRLVAIRKFTGEDVTTERVRRELSDLFQANQRPLGMSDIERAVCEVFGVEGKLLRSDRKTRTVSQPRMLAMWLARKHTKAAFSEIGEYFGGRSHSTVISAHNKVERWVGDNTAIEVACGEANVHDAIRRIETTLRAV